jgi:hypothetical protein
VSVPFDVGLRVRGGTLPQSQAGPQTKERQRALIEPIRTARATRVDRAPKLDGTLNDPLWLQASPVDDFLQREPFEGQAPTEKTEVRILYTKHEVYFGISCLDSDPKGIVATELRRDVMPKACSPRRNSTVDRGFRILSQRCVSAACRSGGV